MAATAFGRPGSPTLSACCRPGSTSARMLDNFEQRFAELKTRRPNDKVLADLYTLADQLEKRGRATQATAVFRHLARTDNTHRDTAVRLARLPDAARRAPPAAPPAAEPSALPRTPALDTVAQAAAARAGRSAATAGGAP